LLLEVFLIAEFLLVVVEVDLLGGVKLDVVCLDEHLVADLTREGVTGLQPLLSDRRYHPSL
jgi:hypothetical protein